MTAFPNELTNLIVSFIQDRKTLLNCSLVSHSFLSISRPAIFSQIYISHKSTSSFLSLCDSPLCTIPLARAKFLEVCEAGTGECFETDVLERLLTWVASDGSGRTLESILGAQLEELSIKGVHCEELDKAGERNLLVWFRNLTKLEMGFVSFESGKQLSRVVDSFPKLQELDLVYIEVLKGVPEDEDADANNSNDARDTTDDVFIFYERGPPKNLHKLSIRDMEPQLLDELIRYGPTLRSFTCVFLVLLFNEDALTVALPAIGKLLQSAKALVQFTFRVHPQNKHNWRYHFDTYLAPHIDFPFCPSLRHLEIGISEEFFIIPFLEHISATPYLHHHSSEPPKSTLQTLRLPPLEFVLTQTGWSSFDALLQKPYFSSLQALRCCVPHGFTLEDYAGGVNSGSSTMSPSQIPGLEDGLKGLRRTFTTTMAPCQGTPGHAILTKRMEAIKERLPRCNERGLLKFDEFIVSIP